MTARRIGRAALRPSRRSAIAPFIVMDVMREANARQARGEGVIHMEVGQPATPAPRLAREAAARAVELDALGYTEALGTGPLRERIARHYAETHGLAVDPERIVVTTGSSAGFVLAFLALFDAGDRIVLPRPCYACYPQIARALGVEPAFIDAGEAQRWAPQPDALARLAAGTRAAGLLLASPANPTGAMLAADSLAALAQTCRSHGLWLISDEIYHGLHYGRPAATALAIDDDAIIVNSFSKYFSMTGWRIGWMVAPARLVRTLERLQQNLYISPPAISQAAALAAFDAREELEGIKAGYACNRNILLEGLTAAGFDRLAPADGAFYVYADVSRFSADSGDFASRMLERIGVAATPGLDFDARDGARFMRFSYSGSGADMAEAMRRLKSWDKS